MRKIDYWFIVPYFFALIPGLAYYLSKSHGDFVLLVNSSRNLFFDATMPWITHFGDGWIFAFACLAFLIYKWRLGLVVTALGLLQLLMSYFLKRVVFKGFPRPKTYFEELNIPLSFVEGVKVHGYHSFPSGHTMTAFALAFFLALYWKRPYLSLLLVTLAILVGFSRVYLLQHFLIDICAGSLVGVILGCSVFFITRKKVPEILC